MIRIYETASWISFVIISKIIFIERKQLPESWKASFFHKVRALNISYYGRLLQTRDIGKLELSKLKKKRHLRANDSIKQMTSAISQIVNVINSFVHGKRLLT